MASFKAWAKCMMLRSIKSHASAPLTSTAKIGPYESFEKKDWCPTTGIGLTTGTSILIVDGDLA